ncbi:MAG TPA: hypothetical protein VFZ73_07320 [Gemmatimonadaceae bacterium]
MNAIRLSTLALLAATITACDTGPVHPVGFREIDRRVGGTGGPTSDISITGTWQRTLVFFDEFGFLHSSETTWTFAADGTAERTVVTTNVTLGASDTTFTQARWRVEGTQVIIDFTAPTPGTITLEFFLQGTTLFLAGQEYERVT